MNLNLTHVYSIEQYVPERDAEEMRTLDNKIFAPISKIKDLPFSFYLKSNGFLLRNREGKIVSYVLYDIEADGDIYISALGTDGPYEGKGLGTKLVNHITSLYRNHDIRLKLEPNSRQEGLLTFYTNRGFIHDGNTIHMIMKKH